MVEQKGTYHPKCQETSGLATVLCEDVMVSRVEYGNETRNLEFHAVYSCPICKVVEVKKIDERLANTLCSKDAKFQTLEISLDPDNLSVEFEVGPIHSGEFDNLMMDTTIHGPAGFLTEAEQNQLANGGLI